MRLITVLIFVTHLYWVLGYLPKLPNNELLVDPHRELPGAETIDCRQGSLIASDFKRSNMLSPSEALTQDNFKKYPFTSHTVVPGSIVNGGEGRFLIAKMTYGLISKRTAYAFQIADRAVGDSAYWLPQGGVIDIPSTPNAGQPKYVFTADYSGCSWTVTPMNGKLFRLRHVEGGKEVAQFNNLTIEEKGGPTTYALQFKDYAYIHKNGRLIKHMTAYAYMHFSSGQWAMYVQHKTCAPSPGNFVYKDGQIDTCKMTYYNQKQYSEITGTEVFRIP